MPLRRPGYLPGELYHLVCRGVRAEPIFITGTHFSVFLHTAGSRLGEHDHRLLAYCLMPNHVHLFLRCGRASLSAFMHRLLLSYAHFFNRSRDARGHVFQGRHHSRHCVEDDYAREILRYIHLNPVRAGICERAQDYPWSSARAYLGAQERLPVAVAEGLALFGESARSARRAFAAFLEESIPAQREEEWRRLDTWLRPAGGSAEAERSEGGDRPAIRKIFAAAGQVCRVAPQDVRRRIPDSIRARRLAAHIAARDFGYTLSDIGRELGYSRQAVHRWLCQPAHSELASARPEVLELLGEEVDIGWPR